MIKRIIFDIDGTLITGVNFSKYIENTLKRYGIEDLEKTKKFLVGIREYEKNHDCYERKQYLDFFSKHLGIKLEPRFLSIFFDELQAAIPENSTKIRAMLEDLKEYELVLLSNYFEESQRNRLRNMKINDYFTEYYGEKKIKPNREAYLSAKGKHKKEECLIVGDDPILDIEVPSTLGFHTLQVGRGKKINSVEEITKELIKKIGAKTK